MSLSRPHSTAALIARLNDDLEPHIQAMARSTSLLNFHQQQTVLATKEELLALAPIAGLLARDEGTNEEDLRSPVTLEDEAIAAPTPQVERSSSETPSMRSLSAYNEKHPNLLMRELAVRSRIGSLYVQTMGAINPIPVNQTEDQFTLPPRIQNTRRARYS